MMKLDEAGVRKTISVCAMNIGIFAAGEKEDQDLKSLKEQVKEASAVYKEGKAENSTKISFLREVLESRGVAVPSLSDFIKETTKD